MKIQRVHILSSILAVVFSGAVVFFTSQKQNYLNVDESEVKLPEVFEQSTGRVELTFKVAKSELKAGETTKVSMTLTNKGNVSIRNFIYKVKVPDQFTIDESSISAFNFTGVFLDDVKVSNNEIVVYMVNYPSVNIDSALPLGTELISFLVTTKDNAKPGEYIIGLADDLNAEFLNDDWRYGPTNVLDKTTNASLSVIDGNAIVINQPALNIYTPTTYVERYKFEGTKQAGTGIKINGQVAFSESEALTWEANMPLTKLGKNQFEFKAFKSNNESALVKVEIFKHGLADLIVEYNSSQESKVDIDDLALFIKAYRDFRDTKNRVISPSDETSYRLSDMNSVSGGIGDGIIDVDDLAEFIKNWRKVYTYVK